MTQPQPFQDIADNLSFLDDWEDRMNYLIELGQALQHPFVDGIQEEDHLGPLGHQRLDPLLDFVLVFDGGGDRRLGPDGDPRPPRGGSSPRPLPSRARAARSH